MTFTELTAVAIDMRSGNEDVITATLYNDAALVALYKDTAKKEMKLDMESSLAIAPDDADSLDAVVNAHIIRLQIALGHKQLTMFFKKINAGEDSKANERMKYHQRQYDNYKNSFSQMRLPNVGSVQFLNISR